MCNICFLSIHDFRLSQGYKFGMAANMLGVVESIHRLRVAAADWRLVLKDFVDCDILIYLSLRSISCISQWG